MGLAQVGVFQCALHDQQQLFGTDGFDQVLECSGFHGVDRVAQRPKSNKHDDWLCPDQIGKSLEASAVREYYVGDDQVGLVRREKLIRLGPSEGARSELNRALENGGFTLITLEDVPAPQWLEKLEVARKGNEALQLGRRAFFPSRPGLRHNPQVGPAAGGFSSGAVPGRKVAFRARRGLPAGLQSAYRSTALRRMRFLCQIVRAPGYSPGEGS